MPKLIGIGECLIDFLPTEKYNYAMKPGGAPTNVCACVAKLGQEAHFLGKLSQDYFGKFLLNNIKEYGVKTDFVSFSKRPTSLAIINLDEKGDRSFSFYRENNADLLLNKEDVKEEYFNENDVLHMCSVGLVESPSKYAHIKAIELAKKAKTLISFDVNLRPMLYPSEENLKQTVKEFLPFADFVKVADDELNFIAGKHEEEHQIKKLFEIAKDAKFVFLTKGENGASVYNRDLNKIERKAVKVNAVDTTGAGDSFIGAVIYKFLSNPNLKFEDLKNVLDFAVATSSIVVTKKGAMNAMPKLEEVNKIL